MEIVQDGPLGKVKYYALHIEFQERRSLHVHSYVWVFNAPSINDKEQENYQY